jgi:hypothetical protein
MGRGPTFKAVLEPAREDRRTACMCGRCSEYAYDQDYTNA